MRERGGAGVEGGNKRREARKGWGERERRGVREIRTEGGKDQKRE